MRINVTVKPNARQESVEVAADGTYLVRVNAPPQEGKANERVVELLSQYFGKPKSCFVQEHGRKSRKKIFRVE